MEWLGAAIALLAALVAGWQAWEARRARNEAKLASDAAAKHEAAMESILNDVSNSGARSAVAAEGIDVSSAVSAEALRKIAMSPPPWKLWQQGGEGTWRLMNDSTTAVYTRGIRLEVPEYDELLVTEGWQPQEQKLWNPSDWERLTNQAAGSMASPGEMTILVPWRWFDDPEEAPDRIWKGTIH